MAITYGFFNSVDGDRKYNAQDIGRYLHGIVSSGVYADSSTSLQVLAVGGMNVQVQPGRAMLNYHYMENDEPLTLTLPAGATQNRLDAIVARVDMIERRCEITVKTGIPAASVAPPLMQRTAERMEYALAYVHVEKYATAITQENIQDKRPDNNVCGWVHGLINQVDTSTLQLQYEEAYANKMADLEAYFNEKKAEIDSRLDSIDTVINGTNVAGVPIPTASNVGQVPTVHRSGTRYTLADLPIKKLTNVQEFSLLTATSADAGLYFTTTDMNLVGKNKNGNDVSAFIWAGSVFSVRFSVMYSGGVEVGAEVYLTDFYTSHTAKQTIKWDENKVQNSWKFERNPMFVMTVNGEEPDADGNVNV